MNIQYSHGSFELLDAIRLLWEGLNQHHEQVSPYFKDEFSTNTFELRKAKIIQRYEHGLLRVDLAQSQDDPVGYCVSGVHPDGIGEIESIFVAKEFRGSNVGEVLMRHALDWLDGQGVTFKIVDVAVGNERAYHFYARFGFFPRVTRLKQKDADTP